MITFISTYMLLMYTFLVCLVMLLTQRNVFCGSELMLMTEVSFDLHRLVTGVQSYSCIGTKRVQVPIKEPFLYDEMLSIDTIVLFLQKTCFLKLLYLYME